MGIILDKIIEVNELPVQKLIEHFDNQPHINLTTHLRLLHNSIR